MSDTELDTEWKPTGRPQSTMAISFSTALDSLFGLDDALADLDATVNEKKKAVSSQTSELEALEARLKATEERLKLAGISPAPKPAPTEQEPTNPPVAEQKTISRPQTKDGKTIDIHAAQNTPAMPGALPPTPGASEDEESPDESSAAEQKSA